MINLIHVFILQGGCCDLQKWSKLFKVVQLLVKDKAEVQTRCLHPVSFFTTDFAGIVPLETAVLVLHVTYNLK